MAKNSSTSRHVFQCKRRQKRSPWKKRTPRLIDSALANSRAQRCSPLPNDEAQPRTRSTVLNRALSSAHGLVCRPFCETLIWGLAAGTDGLCFISVLVAAPTTGLHPRHDAILANDISR